MITKGDLTMLMYKQLFMNYMDQNNIKYVDRGENRVRVTYNGENLNTIPIIVIFDKDGGNTVAFKCWDIANFKNKVDTGINVCNKLNNHWRWVTFCIDDDGDVAASLDSYVDDFNCGELCMNLVRRMVNIIDDAYPDIARALWA